MRILLVCNHKDPNPWVEALKAHIPRVQVEVFPRCTDLTKVEFAICWNPPEGLWTQLPNLKVIQSLGAGVDHLFLPDPIPPYCTVSRIVDPKLSQDMFEFILASIMSHLRHFFHYAQNKTNREWHAISYQRISDTKVAILGLGFIGSHVARMLSAVGFEVTGWSQSAKNFDGIRTFVGEHGLAKCLDQAQILVNILPLTIYTKHLLGLETLSHLRNGAYLINVGRGAHLVQNDLLYLLEADKLSGALLDVFEQEPLSKAHPFWEHPSIQITPHTASLTNVDTAVQQIVENYQRFIQGAPLLNRVSIAKGY